MIGELRQNVPLTAPRFQLESPYLTSVVTRNGREFESRMQLRTEKPEITAKNYLSVGPGEYPCGNNLI